MRVSVKFILKPDGTRPADGNIGTTAGFAAEITRGNQILAATDRGYRLQVVEYLDIRPPVPGGQASDFWFNLAARTNRAFFEGAATADQTTWRWSANSINIYVNNSSSGQCSFVDTGGAITLGNDIGSIPGNKINSGLHPVIFADSLAALAVNSDGERTKIKSRTA